MEPTAKCIVCGKTAFKTNLYSIVCECGCDSAICYECLKGVETENGEILIDKVKPRKEEN